MSTPMEPQDDGLDAGAREVRAAWRELGDTDPGAALDARVRAAVAAELHRGAGRRTLQRWTPWAAAASVLLATGLGYRAWRESTPLPEARLVRSAVVPPAQAPPSELAPKPVLPADSARQREEHLVQPPAAPAPAPALASKRESVPVASLEPALEEVVVAPPARKREPEQLARDRRSPSPTAAAAASSATGASANAADAAPPPPLPPEWLEARRLLAAGRQAEARAVMARWREKHGDMRLPADLAELLGESGR